MALKGTHIAEKFMGNGAGKQVDTVNNANMNSNNSRSGDVELAERDQLDHVLFGDELHRIAPILPEGDSVFSFKGCDVAGKKNISITRDILSKHCMLLGGIGTGKTNAFFQIISQIKDKMTKDDIMIIFDTKGDFLHEFYEPGDVVISNDLSAVGPDGKPDYWNIFNEVSMNEQQYASVMEIAKSLFKEATEKTNQIFFPNAARDIFMATMLHFLHYYESKGNDKFLNNEELINFLKNKNSKELRGMLDSYKDMRAMTSYIAKDDSPQTQGVLSELQQVVREIFVGNFAKKGTLGLRNLVREKGGRKIFIEYDLNYGSLLTPIYNLMFDMAIKEALGRERTRGDVYFVTDEFRLLPNLDHVDNAVNFGRSLGIKFLIGVQNVEQIYENYGVERAHSIMSGFLTTLNFRVKDPKTREYIKEQFGKNRKMEVYSTFVQGKSKIEHLRDGYVVEDWDISNLKTGECIIGLPNASPFLFKFDLWNQ